MATDKLFKDFPSISSKEWREKIEADLKGADFNKKLVWHTDEGFDVQPYYREEDLEHLGISSFDKASDIFSAHSAPGNNWKIRQDFNVEGTPETCNEKLKQAIKGGIESIGLNMISLKNISKEFLDKLLADINLQNTELNFSKVKDPLSLFHSLTEYSKQAGLKPEAIHGTLGLDPLGSLIESGELEMNQAEQIAELLRMAKSLPNIRIISINAGHIQDSGSTLSQELGFGLSMANEYIDILTQKGLKAETIIRSIAFNFVTGPNYFMEIAKLRAARWLWTSICKEWGVNEEEVSMYIHSRTASWNLTVYDANVNMLRTTTEAMSAALGGSNSISVVPYDLTFRQENDFSSRIARNTQIILKDEAYFSKVSDPSAGSYYIEQLTESLAEQAWKHFMEVEDRKGFTEAFKEGFVQNEVLASATKKRELAASRRNSILGVNQYPNFSEMVLELGDITSPKASTKKSTYPPLFPFKVSEEFENLRLQTEKNGKRPKVFLLKYGDAAWRTARAMFAGNFFACAGYEIIDSSGFKNFEEGLQAAGKAKAEIIVICSSDAEYTVLNTEEIKKGLTKAELVIAGFPSEAIDTLKEQGIKHFIHVKSNLLGELKKFHEILKIV